MSRATRALRAAGAAALLLALACKTGPDLSTDYGQTASENYELAVGEFADRDWEEAISYADFVRIRFPFSRYAVEAELLIARAEFGRRDYVVAQDSFRQFSKLHPTHKHVRNGWVPYMAALSAFKDAPSSLYVLPPYYQKDQSQLRDALIELRYFFDHHAGSVMEPYAIKLRDEVNRRLLQHELYVANYYLKRERPEAAVYRLERAHERYPGIGLDADVLFLLGKTYLRLDEIELARATFAELQAEHPTHAHGKQAPLYLAYIYETFGPADPARKRPDRRPPRPVTPPLPKEKPDKDKEKGKRKESAPPPKLPVPKSSSSGGSSKPEAGGSGAPPATGPAGGESSTGAGGPGGEAGTGGRAAEPGGGAAEPGGGAAGTGKKSDDSGKGSPGAGDEAADPGGKAAGAGKKQAEPGKGAGGAGGTSAEPGASGGKSADPGKRAGGAGGTSAEPGKGAGGTGGESAEPGKGSSGTGGAAEPGRGAGAGGTKSAALGGGTGEPPASSRGVFPRSAKTGGVPPTARAVAVERGGSPTPVSSATGHRSHPSAIGSHVPGTARTRDAARPVSAGVGDRPARGR